MPGPTRHRRAQMIRAIGIFIPHTDEKVRLHRAQLEAS